MRKIRIVEVISEFGAGRRGPSLGIDAIRFACLNKNYDIFGKYKTKRITAPSEHLFVDAKFPTAKRIDEIIKVFHEIAETLGKCLEKGAFPLVLSGDHSNAAATIAGIKKQYPDKRLGVIWIDAHGDLHTPYSTPSGNIHGMPMAASLNIVNKDAAVQAPEPDVIESWNSICNMEGIAPKVLPRDVVFIGIRDLEQQEWDIIHKENIRYYDMPKVDNMGVGNVAAETLEHLDQCDLIYVSFDIDSLDGKLAPGTGTPVNFGLSATQAKWLLTAFWKSPKLAALEFTEVNPLLDHKNKTAGIAADLLNRLLQTPTE